MSILEKEIRIRKHPKNFKYYNNKFNEEKGYYVVPIEYLSNGSKVDVTRVCDECGSKKIRPYRDVLRYRKNGKDYCWECGNNTAEALRNKSESHKGYEWKEESKLKASKTHTGMKHSEETKNRISFSVKETTSTKEWREWIKKYNYENYSLNAYIKKYGKEEGERLYKIERRSKNPYCIEYWLIKKNGNMQEAIDSLSDFQRKDLNYFIEKYGDEIGKERYLDWNAKKLSNNEKKYSKTSQKFIEDIIHSLELEEESLYYGEDEWLVFLNKEEKNIFEKRNLFSLDFFDRRNNINIEYDGNYWHSREEQKNLDIERDRILKNRGFKILRINESDYLNNREKIIAEVKNFYENNKN